MSTEKLLMTLVALVTLSVGLQVITLVRQAPLQERTENPGSSRSEHTLEAIRDAPDGVMMSIAGLPTEGSPSAKVVLIEFSDYECPYCARHARVVLPQLREEYVSSGKLRYVFSNLPLPMHPNAKTLAVSALCAGEHGKYWAMHDLIFEELPRDRQIILELARQLGLKKAQFEECLDGTTYGRNIQKDEEVASNLGVRSTPSFALGLVDSDGTATIKKFIVGAQTLPVFRSALSEFLAQAR